MIVVYIIVGIILALLLAGLVIPKGIKATKEIVINKPVSEVYNYVKYLKNQDNYSKWGSMDPSMKKTYTGTDGTVGFVSAWEGNKKVGQGEQEIKAIKEGQQIDFELRFIKPFRSLASAKMTTEAVDATSTRVSWGFESNMNYPMNVMKLFMNMEKAVGNDFSTGLSNLKNLLEKS